MFAGGGGEFFSWLDALPAPLPYFRHSLYRGRIKARFHYASYCMQHCMRRCMHLASCPNTPCKLQRGRSNLAVWCMRGRSAFPSYSYLCMCYRMQHRAPTRKRQDSWKRGIVVTSLLLTRWQKIHYKEVFYGFCSLCRGSFYWVFWRRLKRT